MPCGNAQMLIPSLFESRVHHQYPDDHSHSNTAQMEGTHGTRLTGMEYLLGCPELSHNNLIVVY